MLQVDNIHCAISADMVAVRLFTLDRAILYDEIVD